LKYYLVLLFNSKPIKSK